MTTEIFRSQQSVAVIGLGVVGSRVARQLASSGTRILLHDVRDEVQKRVAASLQAEEITDLAALDPSLTPVVVLAMGTSQCELARLLIESGHHVITTGDEIHDTRQLMDLESLAQAQAVSLVIGAAASPGLSGLLVAELATRVDNVDEIHVAFHGTGGPACARQHHRALANEAVGWRDGEWTNHPGGSGRELFWFPEPIGGKDCYRAELVDPFLLHRAFPNANRISARVSATRRDRLTSRLPMMSPPHSEGGVGGVRVEIRGSLDGQRRTEVAGVAERTGIITAAVASGAAAAVLRSPKSGLVILGDNKLNNRDLLDDVIRRGITVFEYMGSGA